MRRSLKVSPFIVGFEPTYEGLKPGTGYHLVKGSTSFEPTYEGLKLAN